MHLLEWQYLIFLMPLGLGVLYLLVLAIGMPLGGEAEADVDAHVDLDVHTDVDVDVAADAAVDVGHADVGHHVDVGPLTAVATFLGVGRVPISIVVLSLAFVWGVAGLAGVSLYGPGAVWMAAGAAGVAAIVVTRYVAKLVGRLVPSVATYHTPSQALVGLRGMVVYQVTGDSGVVRLTDDRGTMRDVRCRVAEGQPPIPGDTKVILLRHDHERDEFLVTRCP